MDAFTKTHTQLDIVANQAKKQFNSKRVLKFSLIFLAICITLMAFYLVAILFLEGRNDLSILILFFLIFILFRVVLQIYKDQFNKSKILVKQLILSVFLSTGHLPQNEHPGYVNEMTSELISYAELLYYDEGFWNEYGKTRPTAEDIKSRIDSNSVFSFSEVEINEALSFYQTFDPIELRPILSDLIDALS